MKAKIDNSPFPVGVPVPHCEKRLKAGLRRLRLATAATLLISAGVLAAASVAKLKLPWAAPMVPVGRGSAGIAMDTATNTIYVANSGSRTISVIDGATCNATNTSICAPIATMTRVGRNPISLTLDPSTHTLYATNGLKNGGGDGNKVAVLNVAACTAKNTSGCSQEPVAVAKLPGFTNEQATGNLAVMALDSSTHTLYVGDAHDGPVAMVNAATCNALRTTGCSHVPTTLADGDAITIDPSNHSIYVNNADFGGFLVFNGLTCNAETQSDCSVASVGQLPAGYLTLIAGIEPITHTIYLPLAVTGDILGYVAVIDGSTCNATEHSGCEQTPPLVLAGGFPEQVSIDPTTKTAFVANQNSSSISVINAATCNALDHSGCSAELPTIAVATNPLFFALNVANHTIYSTSQDTGTVWVIDASQCNATYSVGCTKFAQTAIVGGNPIHARENPDTHSLYVTNQSEDSFSIVDTSVCNQTNLADCNQTWPKFNVGGGPRFLGINKVTNTIYVSLIDDNTLAVIDGATCNSSITTGCGSVITTAVGIGPQQVAVDEVTNTIYVENQSDSTVSVIDGSHCNATDSSGCGQSWPTAPVGTTPQGLTLKPDDHTLYVTNTDDNTVSVIDGNHCNGGDTSRCTPVATFPVGAGPRTAAVALSTNTLFVGNRDDLTVSVIDSSSCNGTDTSGCPQVPPPTVLAGAFPKMGGTGFNLFGRGIEVDQGTNTVFMPMPADSDVAVLDGNICRADNVTGCQVKIVRKRMGGFALTATFSESTGTVYVVNANDGTISIFPSGD